MKEFDRITFGGAGARWMTIGDALDEVSARFGASEAVTFDGQRRYSYREVSEHVGRLAAGLVRAGVTKGDRVASLLSNSAEQLFVWLGAARVGAIAVPINISVRRNDLIHVLQQCEPAIIFVGTEYAGVYHEAVSMAPAGSFSAEVVLVGSQDVDRGDGHYDQFADEVGELPDVAIDPSDPACILFTGGTTGLPKGTLRTHFSYICSAERYGQIFRPTRSDRHYSSTHLFHCGGQEIGFIGPFTHGVPTYLPPWFSATSYWATVREYGATIVEILPAMINIFMKAAPSEDDRNNVVRLAMGATAGVDIEQRAAFEERFGLQILDMFGMTEVGTMLISNHSDDLQPGSQGKPRDWCEVSIVDERDAPVDAGLVGEICLRPTLPHSMSLGYHGQPEATLDRWRNLWIHTGDLGYVDDDGWLFLVGRQAHWIRRRGENISAVEVENAIDEHPDVVEAAVVGEDSELGEQDVCAYVVLRDGSQLTWEQLAEFCRERLAYFKVPSRFVAIDVLPRSVTKGEIERHKLGVADERA